jgi:RNA-directed DNA polymerase
MTRKSNFSSFSHGFRPGHRQQNALDALTARIKSRKVNWIVDADIRSFNEIDHEWMLRFLAHRIADQRIRRLIRRWLNAVVIGEGQREPAVKGTPQGAVTSPWLANLYLSCAFSLRIQPWPTSPGRGGFIVLRSADYRLVGFEAVRTARAFVEALREPLAKLGLSLHPEKSALQSLAAMRLSACASGRRASRRLSTFWDSRIVLEPINKDSFRSCDKPPRSACAQHWPRFARSSTGDDTNPCRSWVGGFSGF